MSNKQVGAKKGTSGQAREEDAASVCGYTGTRCSNIPNGVSTVEALRGGDADMGLAVRDATTHMTAAAGSSGAAA